MAKQNRIKVLVLEPQSGLCNRMRAIVSAQRLASKYGRELYIVWTSALPNEASGCFSKFTQLFSSDNKIKVIEDFDKFTRGRTIVKYQKTVHGPLVLNLNRDKEEIVYIRTNLWIYDYKDGGNINKYNLFKDGLSKIIPNSRVVEDYTSFVKKNKISEYTTGVHIRQTDITTTTEFGIDGRDIKSQRAALTPHTKYFEYMDAMLKIKPDTKFFLAADNKVSKEDFKQRYGDSLVSFPSRGHSRTKVAHIQDGMTDLYILSKCGTVVSCKGSSFGKVASLIGNKGFVNIDDPPSKTGVDLPSDYSGDHKGIIKTWAIGMTLAPRKTPSHNDTLRSAKAAGFDNIHLYMDGEVEIDKEFKGYPVTLRDPPFGPWKNWIATLEELYQTYPDRDAYAIFQDDVSFCKNVREFAEKTLWADDERSMGVASFYSPSHYERTIPGWYKRNVGINLRPALTFVFTPESLESVLRYFKKNPWRSKANIDNAIGQWARHTKRFPYFFSPSLCQHTGHASVISPWKKIQGKRKSKKFVGEGFDAMEFLDGQ